MKKDTTPKQVAAVKLIVSNGNHVETSNILRSSGGRPLHNAKRQDLIPLAKVRLVNSRQNRAAFGNADTDPVVASHGFLLSMKLRRQRAQLGGAQPGSLGHAACATAA